VSISLILLLTTVFSTQKNKKIVSNQCDQWLKKIKEIHNVTPEKVDFKSTTCGSNWAFFAKVQGEKELFKEIQKNEKSRSSLFWKIAYSIFHIKEQREVNEVQKERKIIK